MHIPKGKVRIAITIHQETKALMNEVLPLHKESLTYSNLIERALVLYAKAKVDELDNITQEKEKN